MRAALAVVAIGLLLALLMADFTALSPVVADDIITRVVTCGTTRSHVLAANPNRIGAVVQNVGTVHANVGRGTVGMTLHVGSALNLTPGYLGGLECSTQPGTGSTLIETYEEVR